MGCAPLCHVYGQNIAVTRQTYIDAPRYQALESITHNYISKEHNLWNEHSFKEMIFKPLT